MASCQYYSDKDIVSFLSSCFDMKVTVEDMRSPKPDFVQKVYCNFLLDFGANLDQLNQVKYSTSNCFYEIDIISHL